ncbi:MAG: sugar ABC transporter ATP-binding protein [Ancalomicrobiaceae bacterium]|nr:sugar ABC transporter ATP-binding protein [Ancalomicrobiaceae bacterium]
MLDIRGLEKSFGGVRALAGANLSVEAGSVHGLLGENGAGKSTLIKALSGLVTPDRGEIRLDGSICEIHGVQHAEELGFRFIHQELSVVPYFTAVENAFVGRSYPRRGPFFNKQAMRNMVAGTARDIAPDLPLDLPVGRMTTGQKQLVEIIRALMGSPARLVVMDEPTASLSDGEARRLHSAVRGLAERGVAVIFISHRLDEVTEICDHFTVLRNGATVGGGAIGETNRGHLVELMSGRQEVVVARPQPHTGSEVVLDVDGLAFGDRGNRVSFQIHAGEILGLYGLVGAGRSSLMKIIWGARRQGVGRISLDGVALRSGRISDRIDRGGAYVPEDRRTQGLITVRSIAENLALTNLPAVRKWSRLPIISWKALAERAAAVKSQLTIRMASPFARPLTLSGGNQQKLLFGRWFGRGIRLLILDEPTRGVDVGAKAELHAIARDFAARGAAVLLTTSDMDELLALANRVLVIAGGEVTATLSGDELKPARIIDAAFQHQERKVSVQ